MSTLRLARRTDIRELLPEESFEAMLVAQDMVVRASGWHGQTHVSLTTGFQAAWLRFDPDAVVEDVIDRLWPRASERNGVSWQDGFLAGWLAHEQYAAA